MKILIIMGSMETLSKLFGSENKVKILRLFLSNPETQFDLAEITTRIKSTGGKVRSEMALLEKMSFVKRRGGRRKRNAGFVLNREFPHLASLQNFLINADPFQPNEITKKIGKLGAIKLVIVAGVFIHNPESRADLLIVGDGVKKARLLNTVKTLESEIGKELKYAYFSTEDFKYRLSMFDKLVRDILDYPHKKVINKLGIV